MTDQDLLLGIQKYDPEAFEEAFRRYEPELRRAIRHCFADPALHSVWSESDIIQSVFLKLWQDATSVDAADAKELLRQLKFLVKRRFVDKARKQKGRSASRPRQVVVPPGFLLEAIAPGSEPFFDVEVHDQIQTAKDHLRPSDHRLLELRFIKGWPWSQIADQLGSTAEGCRKRCERALDRVRRFCGWTRATYLMRL